MPNQNGRGREKRCTDGGWGSRGSGINHWRKQTLAALRGNISGLPPSSSSSDGQNGRNLKVRVCPSPRLQPFLSFTAKPLEGGVCTHLPLIFPPLYSSFCPQHPPGLVLHKALSGAFLLTTGSAPPPSTHSPPGWTLWLGGPSLPLASPLPPQLLLSYPCSFPSLWLLFLHTLPAPPHLLLQLRLC